MILLDKKIISIDCESDGLYGDIFAIGVSVFLNGEEIDSFVGMSSLKEVSNPWVVDNVLPHIKVSNVYDSKEDLREDFWKFWISHKNNAITIVDIGSPVESNLFRKCVEKDLDNRLFQGPYPLHEVATMLLANNIDPDIDRKSYTKDILNYTPSRHNPLDDARMSLATWLKCQGYNTKIIFPLK